MITDMASYLRYFEGFGQRTRRDVAALPPSAAAWRPRTAEGEAGWSIGEIVGHIGSTRLYFASAYRNEGWLWAPVEMDADDQSSWLSWLDTSAARFVALLKDTPNEWLTRRIEMVDTPGRTLSGWRLLMMMLEHEVHHRSQIDSYAGQEGWPVPDIFGRSAESIDALQDAQRAKYATGSTT
ncbi:MAG TPA: DinB family protein [Candidatus Methylomirabilis sp.]|nr:DinB family protein [Candidatus Methylomirabilis sp.]